MLKSANPYGFELTIAGFYLGSVLAAVQRSGAMIASSGRKDDDDPVVIHAVTSGSITFDGAREGYSVQAGNLIVRDAGQPWRLACERNTASHVITIPRGLIRESSSRPTLLRHACVAELAGPEGQLIFEYLDMLRTTDLLDSQAASMMAERAFVSLVAGLLEGNSVQGPTDMGSIILTAKKVIEKNLEREDLSPALVAGRLGISVRTLHRAFSAGDQSVMSLIRQLRMEGARRDLLSSDETDVISRAAAKWHFSDASHFIRNFKSVHGVTPRAYMAERSEAAK
ncbi:AraC family transcriptional regulator [Streptomyces fuscichromogenes]|uniref:Transcriptional regulator n=1 Tax=Streptomyces fuscichromogenes TaxID=1324013 RepID=A0A917XDN0_9ACTN|nr:AraC family transcriptional regulator [Streptomyces fuscichromogenes]GGN13727.1 transcriptional regulator [Streptomyces fuscichromogenes]